MSRRSISLALLTLMFCNPTTGQQGPCHHKRKDFTWHQPVFGTDFSGQFVSGHVIPRRTFQVESNYFSNNPDNWEMNLLHFSFLARYGLSRRLELRSGCWYNYFTKSSDSYYLYSQHRFADAGLKLLLFKLSYKNWESAYAITGSVYSGYGRFESHPYRTSQNGFDLSFNTTQKFADIAEISVSGGVYYNYITNRYPFCLSFISVLKPETSRIGIVIGGSTEKNYMTGYSRYGICYTNNRYVLLTFDMLIVSDKALFGISYTYRFNSKKLLF